MLATHTWRCTAHTAWQSRGTALSPVGEVVPPCDRPMRHAGRMTASENQIVASVPSPDDTEPNDGVEAELGLSGKAEPTELVPRKRGIQDVNTVIFTPQARTESTQTFLMPRRRQALEPKKKVSLSMTVPSLSVTSFRVLSERIDASPVNRLTAAFAG